MIKIDHKCEEHCYKSRSMLVLNADCIFVTSPNPPVGMTLNWRYALLNAVCSVTHK